MSVSLRLGCALLLLAACANDKQPASSQPPGISALSASPSAASGTASATVGKAVDPVPAPLRASLERAAVHHDSFWKHRVLYTWTTAKQLAALRQHRRLLTRTHSADGKRSAFDRRLGADPASELLRSAALRRRRFAWPSPWATLRGWDSEQYGAVLVRLELRADAVVGYFDGTWRFADPEGQPLTTAAIVAAPERLAAIYHVAAPSGAGAEALFREFVLCNEAMIASWEVATPVVNERVTQDVALLEQLRAQMAQAAAPAPTAAPTADSDAAKAKPAAGESVAWGHELQAQVWPAAKPDASLAQLYGGAVAFANSRYELTPSNADAILTALRALPRTGPALRHEVTVSFGAPLPPALRPIRRPPPPPPPRRKMCGGTMC